MLAHPVNRKHDSGLTPHVGEPDACGETQAESYTTPWSDLSQGKAGQRGVADLSPDNNIPSLHRQMALDPIDSENLSKIAGALETTFDPEDLGLDTCPLNRIAHALECIAKSMDSSFVPSHETR